MKRTLLAIVATLAVASGANAFSVSINSDKATYATGETITITAILDTNGAPAIGVTPAAVSLLLVHLKKIQRAA